MLHTVSLKENKAFRRLYRRGACAGNRYLVIYCRRNGSEISRLGFTVSPKLGHAVVRNRIRRRLREIYRAEEPTLAKGYDLVVVARHGAVEAEFSALTRGFAVLLDRLNLRCEP